MSLAYSAFSGFPNDWLSPTNTPAHTAAVPSVFLTRFPIIPRAFIRPRAL